MQPEIEATRDARRLSKQRSQIRALRRGSADNRNMGTISLAAFPCSHWPSRADFLVPSRRGIGTASCFTNTLKPLFVYSLCWNYSPVGEGEHFDILHGSEFTVTIQTLKGPPKLHLHNQALFKHVFSSSGLPIFSSEQKVLVSFVAFGCPRSRGLALPRELDALHTFVSGKAQCPIVSKGKRVKGEK